MAIVTVIEAEPIEPHQRMPHVRALPARPTIQRPLTGYPAGYCNALALATIRNVIYNDKHYLDGVKVIRPAQLLDVATERNTDTFANMAE